MQHLMPMMREGPYPGEYHQPVPAQQPTEHLWQLNKPIVVFSTPNYWWAPYPSSKPPSTPAQKNPVTTPASAPHLSQTHQWPKKTTKPTPTNLISTHCLSLTASRCTQMMNVNVNTVKHHKCPLLWVHHVMFWGHLPSMWNPCGVHVESMWSPCGIHVDWTPFHVESMWTEPHSMWNPCGLTPFQVEWIQSTWSPCGMWGGSKVLSMWHGGRCPHWPHPRPSLALREHSRHWGKGWDSPGSALLSGGQGWCSTTAVAEKRGGVVVVGSKQATWERLAGWFQVWAAGPPRWVFLKLISICRKATIAELDKVLCAVVLGLGSIHACCKIYILSKMVRTL